MVQGSIGRMSALIDNVLDLARGRLGGGLSVALREVNLEPVLQHVVDELRIGLPDQEIQADFALATPVNCDPARIAQMVSNLISNALTHGASNQPVRAFARAQGDELVIWVANGGRPIPPAALERLFQPFFRGEVKASQHGLGLGLYIASEIARAHDGILTAESSEEETRFTFRLTRNAAPREA
jgi:sigma-B regulation protein RsbU (phosphoserine phosphatase)